MVVERFSSIVVNLGQQQKTRDVRQFSSYGALKKNCDDLFVVSRFFITKLADRTFKSISTICSQLKVSASQELSGDARCLGNHLKTFFGTRNRLKTPSKHKISAPAAGKLDKKTFRFFYNSNNCNSYFFVLIVAAFVLKGHCRSDRAEARRLLWTKMGR